MCNPAFIIGGLMAGTQILTQQMGAKRTNEASEKNAQAMIAQSLGEQSARFIQNASENANTVRESYARKLAEEESIASQKVAFGSIIGTPRTDTQRAILNSAMDAEWQLAEAGKLIRLRTQDDMSNIYSKTLAGISSLPTVGIGEQLMGAIGSGVEGFAWGYKADAMLEAPSNKKVDVQQKTVQ